MDRKFKQFRSITPHHMPLPTFIQTLFAFNGSMRGMKENQKSAISVTDFHQALSFALALAADIAHFRPNRRSTSPMASLTQVGRP